MRFRQFPRSAAVLKSDWLSLAMRPFLIVLLCAALAASLLAQKPKKKKPDEEPRPQALEVIPEPPEAVIAEPGRLSFQVSPLSDKGLLSQQVHDALKALGTLEPWRDDRQTTGVCRRVGRFTADQGHRGRRTSPARSSRCQP